MAKLFMAGMVPGIMMGIGFMFVCAFVAKRRNYPSRERDSSRGRLIATGRAGWSPLLPLIIIGGIVFGIMTCTEAAAVAVVYAMLVGALILIIGCFLEPLPAMIVFFPALSALGIEMGLDPIHLGLVMALNLMIGMLAPPVGFLLFIVSAIGDVKMMPLVSEVFPFLLITLGVLLLATLYPPIATWMPSLIH